MFLHGDTFSLILTINMEKRRYSKYAHLTEEQKNELRKEKARERERNAALILSDRYVRRLLVKKGFLRESITQEMIDYTKKKMWEDRIKRARIEENRKHKLQRTRAVIKKKGKERAERFKGKPKNT